MPDFGWSAGCVFEAIKLINTTRKALRDVNGSIEQYQEAFNFLGSMCSTLELLQRYIETSAVDSLTEAIKEHFLRIGEPWKKFEAVLQKYQPDLKADSTRSKLRQATSKVKWALKKIDDAVRELKEDVMQPIQAINCILTLSALEQAAKQQGATLTKEQCSQIMESVSKVIALDIDKCRTLVAASDTEQKKWNHEQAERLEEIMALLRRIDYTTKLDDLPATRAPEEAATMTEQIVSLQALQTNLENQIDVLNRQRSLRSQLSVQHIIAFALGAFTASFSIGVLGSGIPSQMEFGTLYAQTPSTSDEHRNTKSKGSSNVPSMPSDQFDVAEVSVSSYLGRSQKRRLSFAVRTKSKKANPTQQFSKHQGSSRHTFGRVTGSLVSPGNVNLPIALKHI
ncbi:hypothetical protein BDV96DRAFT_640061 [Lophiotrema nucula]|uniref:Fungal N-terminal domain-containing protein n=1 Tax=Lophiotrema nucula TaxID=690887 RepID=A0A6A5ZQN8_9PLEO|nr:hypothetical protein BDV96DRAFT_640061 [Lophiotrema nucula]